MNEAPVGLREYLLKGLYHDRIPDGVAVGGWSFADAVPGPATELFEWMTLKGRIGEVTKPGVEQVVKEFYGGKGFRFVENALYNQFENDAGQALLVAISAVSGSELRVDASYAPHFP